MRTGPPRLDGQPLSLACLACLARLQPIKCDGGFSGRWHIDEAFAREAVNEASLD